MKRLCILAATGGLLATMLSLSCAATNLNSSKSNIYRVVYDPQVVSSAQASALLAELDKLGPADEATLKKWLPANFKKHGVQEDRIKKIVVLPASNTRKTITIIFLQNPADEASALAVSDEGTPRDKSKKSTK